MSDTLSIPSLSLQDPNVFDARQACCGIDADWITEMQSDAWSRYQSLPAPVRTNENWRFANLTRFREIDPFVPVNSTDADIPSALDNSRFIKSAAGRLAFADDALVGSTEISAELTEQGVIFTTLVDAAAKHPELLKGLFLKHSPELGSQKFEALHLAMLRNGIFLYIPDGVKVENPFVVQNLAVQDGGAIFPHTLFYVGNGASASLIELQDCAEKETKHLVIANAHLHAGDGANLSHSILQNWNLNTLSMQLNTSSAESNTTAKSTLINLGSIQARQEIHGRIFGSESNVELYALNVPGTTQEFDQRTLQTHIAANSRSDLLFKNALMDKSKTIFSGLIIVEENAQQTDAYQTNNNLMLSEDAEANSLPGLEIKANDVKCSHGATTGRIDDSELFYFLARGIPRKTAQQLMIFGYADEVIEKLGHPELLDFVREKVQAKFTDA
jgi:Fe-S cluster assembly protein SufD